jgi:hypothetical protein
MSPTTSRRASAPAIISMQDLSAAYPGSFEDLTRNDAHHRISPPPPPPSGTKFLLLVAIHRFWYLLNWNPFQTHANRGHCRGCPTPSIKSILFAQESEQRYVV